jgi:hypothetical protein
MEAFAKPPGRKQVYECLRCGHTDTRETKE